jgi:hypothetical protein
MAAARYRTTTIEQVEALDGPGTLTWHPLRAALDVRAFGINGYTASQAGEDVVEPHRETVHQEIYLVLAGSATFTVDGDTFDAPAGTFVFLPEPDVDRQAVAREAGTTVLAIGGPPTYEPSGWEWYFRASAIRETDLAGARGVLEEGLSEHPESARMHYEMARQLAVEGDAEGSLTELRRTAELDAGRVVDAPDDPDLVSLHERTDFRQLVERAKGTT